MKINDVLSEEKVRLDPKCWKGKHKEGTKIKGGVRVNNCVPNESVTEMDSQKPQGRYKADGTRSHSTYGSRDHYNLGDPETTLGPDSVLTAKDVAKKASKELDKAFGKSHKKGVAEGSDELYQKAIRKYTQRVANDYLGGGNEYLYGAGGFDSEMFGVDPKQAQQDFKSLFPQYVKKLQSGEQGVAEGWTKLPSGDYQNSHTGVRSSKPPVQKKVRGYKWEVHFDYGPHMSDSIVVTATSENEARAKAEKAAEKKGFSIMINSVTPVEQGVAEGFSGEYDDEAGSAQSNLYTIAQAAKGLMDTIESHDDLPEWAQEKIAKVEGMLVTVWNYLQSQKAQGIDPKIMEMYQGLVEDCDRAKQKVELVEEFNLIETVVNNLAARYGVSTDMVWEDLETLTDDELYVFAVTSEPIMEDWQKANKHDKTDGMSQKAVNSYRREHPGSKLKTAVTTKPSKLKKGSKASKRRKSYCSRSRGQMKMHNISCAKTPDKAICKARRRWNC